ncbi:hypothetical protein D0Y65_021690 [Glycine soja]|uniref:Uncharacterized protein n=1 Tax=Glycine soja TaxID=3848 RepID=A0A445JKI1_GLYSO|nr:hypothetical protein D0Y65_021690 [Glycine soja]
MQEGSSAPCSFRISSEGLPLILPYITKQILHASPADFKHLLQNKEVKFEDFTDVAGIGGLIKTLHLDWSPLCCCVIHAHRRFDIRFLYEKLCKKLVYQPEFQQWLQLPLP